MLVIGDLHGDYYKMTRILQENNIIKIDNEFSTDNEFSLDSVEILNDDIFIVFIGDYIDWRGEDIENPYDIDRKELVRGTYKIVKLLSYLISKRGKIFTLVGNHEDMMFRALKILDKIDKNIFNDIIDRVAGNPYSVMKDLAEMNIIDDFLNFYNWYSQGGRNTIEAFGSFDLLLESINNDEIFKNLLLFVYFEQEDGSRLVFSHTFPDDLDCVDRIIGDSITDKDIPLLIWSRKIWGIDAWVGAKTKPFDKKTILEVLDKNRIVRYFVGHTRISMDPGPNFHLDGRIVNLDNHGIINSKPFFQENFSFSKVVYRSYNSFGSL